MQNWGKPDGDIVAEFECFCALGAPADPLPRFAVVVVDITWVMVGGRLLGPLNDWVCEFATIVSQIHGVL